MNNVSTSKLLINENPMMVLPSLAVKIGMDEALVLQQIHFWLTSNQLTDKKQVFRDGRWWTYNSAVDWHEKQFPWWSIETIERILLTLERMGLIIAERYDRYQYKQRKWYSIDYDALGLLSQSTYSGCKDTRQKRTEVVARITLKSPESSKNGLPQFEAIDKNNLSRSNRSDCGNDLKRLNKREIKETRSECKATEDGLAKNGSFDFHHEEESVSRKEGSDRSKPKQSTTLVKEKDLATNQQDKDLGGYSAKFSYEKINNQLFKFDDYGVVVLPDDPSNKLARALTLRAAQFWVWRSWSCHDCRMGVDPDGDVWVFDPHPHLGGWVQEDEMMPLSKMIELAEGDAGSTRVGTIDIDDLNDYMITSFENAQKWLKTPGNGAYAKKTSAARLFSFKLEKLTWEELDIEFEDEE